MTTITERQEVILFYLCGLAPIGEPVQVPHKWLETDFSGLDHSSFCQFVRHLVASGAVEITAKGTEATPSVLRVLKRPETFAIKSFGRSSCVAPPRKPVRLRRFAGYDAAEAL